MQVCVKIISLLAVSASAAGTLASPLDSYAVSAKLIHAGQSFAEPSALLIPGKPASVQVNGPDGYKLTLTLTYIAADQIQIAADLNSSHGSMTPTVVVRPGQPASVSVGDLGLELTVKPSDG